MIKVVGKKDLRNKDFSKAMKIVNNSVGIIATIHLASEIMKFIKK